MPTEESNEVRNADVKYFGEIEEHRKTHIDQR